MQGQQQIILELKIRRDNNQIDINKVLLHRNKQKKLV